MPTYSYNRDIPDAPNNPSVDQPKMKTNTNSTDDLIGQDHVSFGIANGGYHKVIHQITQGSNPAAIANINQVYSKDYTPDYTGSTSDTQLFVRTGGGGVSQLTGNDAETDGWCWMGGMLVQWGQVSSPGSSGTVTFKDRGPSSKGIPFPNNIFTVVLTPQQNTASAFLALDNASPPTTTQFKYKANVGLGLQKFYWIAIGN